MPVPSPGLDSAPADVSRVTDRVGAAQEAIRKAYLRRGRYPWVLAHSGGRNSTLLLQLVWEVVESLPESDRRRPIVLVGNDALLESPLAIGRLHGRLDAIRRAARERSVPVTVRTAQPYIDQTFWVEVIGRGEIPPTRRSRWCADRVKTRLMNRLLEQLVRVDGKAVLLIGTRNAESKTHRRNTARRRVSTRRMSRHDSVEGCWSFAPVADFRDEEVWLTLTQRNPRWGGEWPFALIEDDAPSCGTASPRFGCWACTVASKRRHLRGLADSGDRDAGAQERLFEFRDWLAELREDDRNRDRTHRDGGVKRRSDGSYVPGPFTLEVRGRIFRRLLELREKLGVTRLIHPGEIDFIEDIWRRDRIQEECRQALRESFAFSA